MEKKDELKRKRSENWSEEDKMLLKELIRKRVNRIENKNTDTNTNQTKKKAWLEVEESFNGLCSGGQRTVNQLKTQWMATKIVARKQAAEHRKELLKTGGGSQPPEIPVNSNDISVWLPNEFVVDYNEFDSDVVYEEVVVEAFKTTSSENEEIFIDGQQIEHEGVEKIPENIPKSASKLKKKIPIKRKNATEDNIKKLTEFDMECRTELHKLQIEAEKARIRNLNREYDLIEAKIKFYENKSFGMYVFIKDTWFKQ